MLSCTSGAGFNLCPLQLGHIKHSLEKMISEATVMFWNETAAGCSLPYANGIHLEPCLEYKLKHHFTINYMCAVINTEL